MKLVRFGAGQIGVMRDGKVFDATAVVGADASEWPPVGMLRLIRNFDALRSKLERLPEQAAPVANAHLLPPLVWPHKLLAYPVNYLAHGQEMSSTNRANINGFFMKSSSSISGPNDPIVIPELTGRQVHHECELGIIIGKGGRHITTDDALSHIFGYCCLVDCTVRGNEERVMRKSYDTFTPIGPAIVTQDEVGDAANLRMKLWVNDELRQDANTKDMIVDIPNMIAVASSVLTLEPGDLIASGTPAGVGPIWPGDRLTIEIERVGRMSLPVVQGRGGSNLAINGEYAWKAAQ